MGLFSETANGADDIWWILEGKDYPRLWWEPAGRSGAAAVVENLCPGR